MAIKDEIKKKIISEYMFGVKPIITYNKYSISKPTYFRLIKKFENNEIFPEMRLIEFKLLPFIIL